MCDACSQCFACNCCKPYILTAKYTQCHLKFTCNWPSCIKVKVFDIRDDMHRTPNYSHYDNANKILILGSSGVGKSSVFKSVKFNTHDPNMETEREESRHVIRQNLVAGMLSLLTKSQLLYESYNPSYNMDQKYNSDIIHGYKGLSDENLLKCLVNMDDQTISAIQLCVNYGTESFSEVLDYSEVNELGKAIDMLWNLSAVQQTFLFRLKRYYSYPANMDFFFDKCIQVMSKQYTPTEEDALKLRVRTTGGIEYRYEDEKERQFIIYDNGGERNERKKWIHYFCDVSCVLYVSALNQYCKSLFEDETYIALLESMDLFDEICNAKWFHNSVIVLLLNKTDLFRKHLKITPLTFCFGDEYKGRNFGDKITDSNDIKSAVNIMKNILMYFMDYYDVNMKNNGLNIPNDVILIIAWYFHISEWWLDLCYRDGIDFITHKFMSLNKNPQRKIYVYEVMAVDRVQIESIMTEVHDIIIENRKFRFAQI
eukprot:376802_1